MKIVFFLINMNLGGTEKSFLNLISELPDEYSVDLLLLENSGELLKELPPKIKVHILENNTVINEFLKVGSRQFAIKELRRGHIYSFLKNLIVFILERSGLIAYSFWGISHYIKPHRQKYDTAVAYAGIHNFIAYYTLRKLESNKKFLWIHFDVSKISFNINFANKFYPKFDKIICVSQLVLDNLKNSIQSAPNLHVVHNILDVKEINIKKDLEKIVWDNSVINILTVGRLSKEKGYFDFLPVLHKLKEEGFKFKWWIIGEGNERLNLEKEIVKLGLSEHVELLGKKENPFPYYKACDVYLQPSRYEGHCVSIIEAKYFCKPIISNNFAGISDEIINGENGLICEIEVDSQYHALREIITNKSLRLKFTEMLNNESKEDFLNPFI